MKNIFSKIFTLFILSSSIATAQHEHEVQTTDGVEPYIQTDQLKEYLKAIDPSYLPYMFASDEDMQWWEDAKFGVFVHWSPSVVTETALSWSRAGNKPHHRRDNETKGVPEQEYNDTYKTFNPVKFNAEEWVKLWKDSGAKYFVFTAKHHYGFCMWDTKTTEFNVMNTPYGKDVMKELADACHKYDMKLFWYYSQPDWTNELYRQELPSKEYNEQILYPQITELMNNYGKIDGIWFDGLGKHPVTWDTPRVLKIIRTANPQAITNHRQGPKYWHMGDFDGPERGVGRFQTNRPWETCDVIGGGWGYMGEKDAMPYVNVIQLITKIVGNGGNLLLNTGPRPDGSIIEDHAKRYREIGVYLKKYSEAIYETKAGPYVSGPWGSSVWKDNKMYLHLFAKLENNTLVLPQLPAQVKSYKLLTGGDVKLKNNKGELSLSFDDKALSPIITIVEVELNKSIKDIPAIYVQGERLFKGAKVSASSSKSKRNSISNLLPGGATTFSEGIVLPNSWQSDGKDKNPWIEFAWDTKQTINQISIREGKRLGSVGNVSDFEIIAFNDGEWKVVFKGTSIGSFFGFVFEKPITATKLKFKFNKVNGNLEINNIGVY